jgi:hypothetical protein
MESITSFLSPESTERGKAAAIDAAFSSLRAAGANAAVEEFYPKIVAAIENKNLDEFDALGERVLGFATKNMDVPAEGREAQNDAARSISQLASIADEKNITIPSALLNDAANAFVSKDQGALTGLAKSIGSLVDAGMKVQQDEQKIQKQLTDGGFVLIGDKSGTRYDNIGNPIPSGNKNSQLFASLASQAYSPQSKEIIAMMGGGNDLVGGSAIGAPMQTQPDIVANPEAYAAMQVPDLDTIRRNTKANEEARVLYKSGDRLGALNILRALKARDIFGDITDQTLDNYFGGSPSNTPTPEAPAAPSKKPLSEIIK